MKLVLIIFIVPVLAISLAGAQTTKPQKRAEVIINAQDSTVKAMVFLYTVKLKAKNDRLYFWYQSDAINRNIGGYSGRLLDGKYTVFSRDKKLICSGNFKKGTKHGTWKRWNKTGGLLLDEKYRNGLLNGKVMRVDANGENYVISSYKNGAKSGKEYQYFAQDSVVINTYKRDILISSKSKINGDKSTKKCCLFSCRKKLVDKTPKVKTAETDQNKTEKENRKKEKADLREKRKKEKEKKVE